MQRLGWVVKNLQGSQAPAMCSLSVRGSSLNALPSAAFHRLPQMGERTEAQADRTVARDRACTLCAIHKPEAAGSQKSYSKSAWGAIGP